MVLGRDRQSMGSTAENFAPFTTVRYYLQRMPDSGLIDAIDAVPVAWAPVAEGGASPFATRARAAEPRQAAYIA